MTSTPRKRPAQPGWATPTTSKTCKVQQSTSDRSARMYAATFRVEPQPTRSPLAELLQPRQRPNVHQSKLPCEEQSSSASLPSHSPRVAPADRSLLNASQAATIHHSTPCNRVGQPPSLATQTRAPVASHRSGAPCKPVIRHAEHPESRLGRDFHWVPYPLGLLPYGSWFNLHHKPELTKDKCVLCPVCYKKRNITPHMRKMFLVAERLSWEDGITSMYDKSTNEELNWAVNYDLGILDPFVEDPEQVLGGKNSQTNKFYPYANEYEMQLAFDYVSITENITEATWALWIGRHLDLQRTIEGNDLKRSPKRPSLKEDGLKILEKSSSRQKTPDIETIDLTDSPPKLRTKIPPVSSTPYKVQASGVSLPTPPGPCPYFDDHRRIVSYRSLQDFYELLDKIERTSFVGAMFLEAYAEKLRDDLCKECWFRRNVNLYIY